MTVAPDASRPLLYSGLL